MTISEVQLLAWLDGELDDQGVEAVEQAVKADPALMALAETHFLTMTRLRDAFATLLDAPPDMLSPAGAPAAEADKGDSAKAITSEVGDTAAPAALATMSKRAMWAGLVASSGWLRWALFIPALAAGIFIGRFILGAASQRATPQLATAAPSRGAIIQDRGGALIAAGPLATALQNGLKADDSASIRIALSFRDKAGHLCRSFDAAQLAGIACRDQSGWRLRLVLETSGGSKSGSSESPSVGQAIDSMIAGDPLDTDEEQAAREHGWR